MQLYTDVHDGTGPYLLLVHGILASRAQFAPNLAALSEVSRPVTVELWGHGRSPSPQDLSLFHPDAYVEQFEGIRKSLGVEQWMICGLSLGAALTLRYALDHPGRVSAQIFTNATAAFADEAWTREVREGASERGEALIRGGREALELIPFHPKHAKRLPEAQKARLVEDAALLDPVGVVGAMKYTIPEAPIRGRCKDNQVPTLLVCGTYETSFKEHRAFAEENMPHLEISDLDAGHAVNIEASEAFNARVADFVRKHATD